MKINVCSLDNKSLKEVNLDKNIFQVEVKNEIIYHLKKLIRLYYLKNLKIMDNGENGVKIGDL